MKKLFLFSLFLIGTAFAAPTTRFQNTVTTGSAEMGSATVTGAAKVGGTGTANAKAVLDLESTSKGLLPPRMTTAQRDAIAVPPAGLQIYNTTTNKTNVYNGTAWADVGSGSGGSSFGVLENGGWESGTAGWTASGGTYAVQTTHFVTGPSGASWDSSAAGQTLCSTAYTVSAGVGLSLQNIEGTLNFKCASGTCTHKVQIRDGATVLSEDTISSYTDRFQKRGPAIVGFPASGSLSLCVVSVAADEPALYLDDAYLGAAQSITQVNPVTDEVNLYPVTSNITTNASIASRQSQIGDKLRVEGTITFSGTNTQAVTGSIVLPAGLSVDTSKVPSSRAKAGTWGYRVAASGAQTSGLITVSNANGAIEMVAVAPSANLPYAIAVNDTISFEIMVPITGWTSETAIQPDDQRLPTVQKFTSGSGTYTLPQKVKWIRVRMVGGGGGGTAGGTAVPSTAASAGGNTTFGTTLLIANGGSGATFSGTVGGAGGSASLGTGPLGLAFTGATGSGGIYVGASGASANGSAGGPSPFGGAGSGAHAGGNVGGAAQANTGSGGGGGSANGANASQGGAGGGAGGFVDAIISEPAASYAYAVGAAGAGASGGLANGGPGGAGGSGVIIVEEYYGAMNAPLLIGSVTSDSSGLEKEARVTVGSTCSATPCTIARQSGSAVTSVTRQATGQYTVNFQGGYFSSTPDCYATLAGAVNLSYVVNAESASAFQFNVYTAHTAAATDANFRVLCKGPR